MPDPQTWLKAQFLAMRSITTLSNKIATALPYIHEIHGRLSMPLTSSQLDAFHRDGFITLFSPE
jgi:hypothetical protein